MTSTIKVNNIQNQCGANIINESSNTITLGASGDTIALASGASQTGFGRTGTVDWDTTPKTSNFTAVNGDGFFVNTTSGAITVNLPAGSPGSIVSFKDYANTWQTNNVTVTPNGTDKINGINASAILNTEDQSVTLVYVDSTKGWRVVQDSTSAVDGAQFVTATGGNAVITSGDFKTHIFTGPGTFCVSCGGNPAGSNTVDYFVVAGGGGTSGDRGAGGGAGGFRLSNSVGCVPAPTMSPKANPTGLPVSAQGYPITVGGGGGGAPPAGSGTNGSNSIFSTITSAGGGAGAISASNAGGSGSGGYCGSGAAGNTPPVSPPQGNPGGTGLPSPRYGAGGGGGAGAAGACGSTGPSGGGAGGAGSFLADSVIGPTAPSYGESGPVSSTRYFAGGGGGSWYSINGPASPGAGGVGGGGDGGAASPGNGGSGVTNTGSGGGGGNQNGSPVTGGAGGSGIVIIRYKFQ